jgi:glucose dehydrogenase
VYICAKDGVAVWRSVPAEKQQLEPRGDFFQVEGLFPRNPAAKRYDGRLVAMNLRTNRIVWQHRWPNDMCYSGVMSSGGLIWVGRNRGFLEAYNERNGQLVWRSPKLRAGVNAPPMTFSASGKQYVAVFAGGNGIVSLFGKMKPRYGLSLYAFSLPNLPG